MLGFVSLIKRYHERKDEPGQLVRHLLREMDALWVFLLEHGVETTNNRSERALRFAVMWRKRSQGTNSDKGSRLSRKHPVAQRDLPTTSSLHLRCARRCHPLLPSTGNSPIRRGSNSVNPNLVPL